MSIPSFVASLKEPRTRERTVTENVSAHGARIVTKRYWHRGEETLIMPLTKEFPQEARVVYCQRQANRRFSIGVKFPGRSVKWAGWTEKYARE